MTHKPLRNTNPHSECAKKLGVRCGRIFDRMQAGGMTLRRQSSDTEESISRGGGFLWWLDPGGYRVAPASALKLSQSEFVSPCDDALLDGISQSFIVGR